MPITPEQVEEAQRIQFTAAHDAGRQIRVVAGPGTGKSSTIEERVRDILASGLEPESLCVVSFTRASAHDLRLRISRYCSENGSLAGDAVRVTTLHSLALRALRAAGALGAYPTDPRVLDEWELEQVFDVEFGEVAGVGSKPRREAIRRDHEAFWSTGNHTPPNIHLPDPPVSDEERRRFRSFHVPRTQLYACVLPGEIVRLCVDRIEAGLTDVVELLSISHLIVDEFQDLNPSDLRFVDLLARAGACVFVGDRAYLGGRGSTAR